MFANLRVAVRETRNVCRYKAREKFILAKPEPESGYSAKSVVKMSSNPTWAKPNCAISREVHSSPLRNDYYGGITQHDDAHDARTSTESCKRIAPSECPATEFGAEQTSRTNRALLLPRQRSAVGSIQIDL